MAEGQRCHTYPCHVDLRLKEDMYKKLKKIADGDDRTINYIIRKALGEWLASKEEEKIKVSCCVEGQGNQCRITVK